MVSPAIDPGVSVCDIGMKVFFKKASCGIPLFPPPADAVWVSSVKFLSVLIAVSLIAHAAPSEPGQAAIEFLEKVRTRKVDLEPGKDTALSPHTGADKKREIARRLDRMARDLGSDPLEVGTVKLDENFAAVLVRKLGGFDPGRLQVFPLALIKRDAGWSVAPVPASFENTGTAYTTTLRERLEQLENWMLREQAVEEEKLRAEGAGQMRRKIETGLTARELRGLNAQQIGERFLAACEGENLPAVLGFLGGLAAKYPDDWGMRLKMAELAFRAGGAQATGRWRLLTAPEVLRVLVHHEQSGNRGSFTITCLDPVAKKNGSLPTLTALQFDLAKSPDGLWQVNPPADFMAPPEEPADEEPPPQDSDACKRFPYQWFQAHPPTPQPTAELAHQAFITALQDENLRAMLALSNLGTGPAIDWPIHVQAAQLWWTLHNPAAVRHPLPLSFQTDGTAAVAVLQFFTTRDPDRLDARAFYFEKSATGWHWAPNPSPTLFRFKDWVDGETRRFEGQWQAAALTGCELLATIGDKPAPSREETRKLAEAWLETLRHGDLRVAASHTARGGDPKSGSTLLQNLGYEIIGTRQDGGKTEITGVYQEKTWAAVGMKTQRGGKPAYPLYPVVQTPGGPRILLEIDLSASGSRGREFLNRAAFERLRKLTSAETADGLQTLLDQHRKDIEAATGGISP